MRGFLRGNSELFDQFHFDIPAAFPSCSGGNGEQGVGDGEAGLDVGRLGSGGSHDAARVEAHPEHVQPVSTIDEWFGETRGHPAPKNLRFAFELTEGGPDQELPRHERGNRVAWKPEPVGVSESSPGEGFSGFHRDAPEIEVPSELGEGFLEQIGVPDGHPAGGHHEVTGERGFAQGFH